VNINPKYQGLKKRLKVYLEMDEMWSRVFSKKTPCWLWHAINHENGEVVAYVFGTREHEVLWQLMELLSSINIEIIKVYSDNNPAYHDAIPKNILKVGKKYTQKIERKHLTYRTRLKRLARKTICFSKSIEMHMIMFGMIINHLEFAVKLF
jgi:insertion element IS1 protein InsB